MNKYDIAKEFTLFLLQDGRCIQLKNQPNDVKPFNEQVVDNLADFYNRLVEKLNIPD